MSISIGCTAICNKNYLLFFTPINSEGSQETPAHRYADFKFKTYAPVAFR